MVTRARNAGISDRTLNRAKRSLNVLTRKYGKPGEGGWEWVLPVEQPRLPPRHDDDRPDTFTFAAGAGAVAVAVAVARENRAPWGGVVLPDGRRWFGFLAGLGWLSHLGWLTRMRSGGRRRG